MNYTGILQVYTGSDGAATAALYRLLEDVPDGKIGMNLFRACKASERAKVYRGGYKGDAYRKKSWSLAQLCLALSEASPLDLVWGWGRDENAVNFENVLYVELPTGQVSFHNETRHVGPDYAGEWDGVKNMAPSRICQFVAMQLAQKVAA